MLKKPALELSPEPVLFLFCRMAEFVPNPLQQFSQMVESLLASALLALADAPVVVVPGIPFDEEEAASCQKPLRTSRTRRKLRAQDFQHDAVFYLFPVGTQIHHAPHAFCLTGRCGGKLLSHFWVKRFCGLERSLGVLVPQAVIKHTCPVEIAEKIECAPELVDRKSLVLCQ